MLSIIRAPIRSTGQRGRGTWCTDNRGRTAAARRHHLAAQPGMIRTSIVTLLLLVGSAGVLSGQARSSEPGPVGTLLDLRETLALSSQQISRLEQIDAEMDEQNRPLVRQLAEIRRQIRALGPRSERTDEQRARFEAFVDEARPLMRQIEENNRAAMKRVGRVLT